MNLVMPRVYKVTLVLSFFVYAGTSDLSTASVYDILGDEGLSILQGN